MVPAPLFMPYTYAASSKKEETKWSPLNHFLRNKASGYSNNPLYRRITFSTK
jgi:hypothetical protein